jgi:uncharacterized protein
MIGVHLRQVPPEGLRLEGDEDPAFLDLAEIGAKAAGPVRYELDTGVSGGGVFATGRVSVPVELQCVACLRPFVHEVSVPDFATQVEIEGREFVDLAPSVREDLLLALPNHPRCDLMSDQQCPFQGREHSGGGKPASSGSAWQPLDKLKLER